ncbi:MAG: hypothetical protein WCH10_02730 [bacterium]
MQQKQDVPMVDVVGAMKKLRYVKDGTELMKCIKFLLNAGVDPNYKFKKSSLLLFAASQKFDASKAILLLSSHYHPPLEIDEGAEEYIKYEFKNINEHNLVALSYIPGFFEKINLRPEQKEMLLELRGRNEYTAIRDTALLFNKVENKQEEVVIYGRKIKINRPDPFRTNLDELIKLSVEMIKKAEEIQLVVQKMSNSVIQEEPYSLYERFLEDFPIPLDKFKNLKNSDIYLSGRACAMILRNAVIYDGDVGAGVAINVLMPVINELSDYGKKQFVKYFTDNLDPQIPKHIILGMIAFGKFSSKEYADILNVAIYYQQNFGNNDIVADVINELKERRLENLNFDFVSGLKTPIPANAAKMLAEIPGFSEDVYDIDAEHKQVQKMK